MISFLTECCRGHLHFVWQISTGGREAEKTYPVAPDNAIGYVDLGYDNVYLTALRKPKEHCGELPSAELKALSFRSWVTTLRS